MNVGRPLPADSRAPGGDPAVTGPFTDRELRAFEGSLRSAGQKRLTQREIRLAFADACPQHAAAPDPRALLQALLIALAERQAIRLPDPKRWDASAAPPLPTSLELLRDPAAEPLAARPGWHPALAFAAIERQPAQRDALLRINAWLQSHPSLRPRVPLRERALHIFGDERRLDAFLSPEGLFDGRLPKAAIGVIDTPQPLAHEMQPAAIGAPLLVLAGLASYDSVRRWNAGALAFSAVVHGGGPALLSAVEALQGLVQRSRAARLYYVGDLDAEGLAILDQLRRQLPDMQPHPNLYRWLLRHGRRSSPGGAVATAAVNPAGWPPDLVAAITALFASGQRIAQENFGSRELYGWPSTVPRGS